MREVKVQVHKSKAFPSANGNLFIFCKVKYSYKLGNWFSGNCIHVKDVKHIVCFGELTMTFVSTAEKAIAIHGVPFKTPGPGCETEEGLRNYCIKMN